MTSETAPAPRAPQTGSRAERVDYDLLESSLGSLAARYKSASPFPHVVIDKLVDLDERDIERFPSLDWPGWFRSATNYQPGKATCDDIALIPAPYNELIEELSRPRFLRYLQTITGIDKLLPDPYLVGGGLHVSGGGGTLSRHTDFHYHSTLGLYRRVNLLLYLNPDWTESDGGCLELSGESGEKQLVVPDLGRCVLFTTTDKSVHGVPVPVAEGKSRKSIALYYYTAAEGEEFGGLLTTDWKDHTEQTGFKKARLLASKGVLQGARALTVASYMLNPNHGSAVMKEVVSDYRRRRG
jgi:hypothetical protein